MPDIDLGVATDWREGDMNGRVKLTQNRVYGTSPKRDVLISGPQSVELSINTNLEVDHVKNKFYFTTRYGTMKKIIAILDSEGNLYLAGGLTEAQYRQDLSY
ncbi:DUF6342 family protein [Streptomyces sp. CBMA156]|uniref:DUF6342 family protein n=1 Tax=Streptomyces sp. CBMA156 TaxID=1930280 RepID=UPI001661B4A6|nr:DUF6342 family protein [Streptomyces sp. CBMA156]MBD0674343.1 hypothetical protein [Streptomyces sp. CBMA156]